MISIIVPIYNVRPYLEYCIESICNQTYKNIEIILVDDGSTDGCSEICEKYKRRDPRIVVLHQSNSGLVSARKAGLKVARGQYIAYVDGDDWIEADMYGRMYQKMEEQHVDVILCGHYEDTGDVGKEVFHAVPEGRYGKQKLLHLVYPRMIAGNTFIELGILPGLWGKIFRKECIEKFQFAVDNRMTMGEDAACTYPCLLNADSIYIMRECLYHYRQTTSSMVKKIQNYRLEQEQFRIMYQSAKRSFETYAYIFDLRPQWETYVLFLMIPRADNLYRGYRDLDYLFPFPAVRKNSKIILYGAGVYGQRLFRYLEETGFCHVTAWVDRNYLQFQNMGLAVESPSVIADAEYDAIVIANTYEKSRKALYRELVKKYPKEKVHLFDESLIFSEESKKAFGLLEKNSDQTAKREDKN